MRPMDHTTSVNKVPDLDSLVSSHPGFLPVVETAGMNLVMCSEFSFHTYKVNLVKNRLIGLWAFFLPIT